MRRIFVRSVQGFLERQAREQGHAGARGGSVVFVQRFGSALNLNLHFHALVIDGTYSCAPAELAPRFHAASPLEDSDVEELARTLQRRVTRYLERRGHLPRESAVDDESSERELLALISAASVQGGAALQPESKPPVARLGRGSAARRPMLPGSLCFDHEGFSLHAQVLVPQGQRERLEHLCRYVARPAIATERLSLARDGRVIYGLRRHWRDGTSAVSFDPLTFIERLAALVPRPRAHQHTYHGVLAPAAPYRDLIVPGPRKATTPSATPADCAAAHDSDAERRAKTRRLTWAELLQKVFAIDVLECPHCGARRKLIAMICDGVVVRKILGSSRTAERASNPRALTRRRRTGLRRVRRTPANSEHLRARAPRAREATHCHASKNLPLKRCPTTLRCTPRAPRPSETRESGRFAAPIPRRSATVTAWSGAWKSIRSAA